MGYPWQRWCAGYELVCNCRFWVLNNVAQPKPHTKLMSFFALSYISGSEVPALMSWINLEHAGYGAGYAATGVCCENDKNNTFPNDGGF